MYIDDMVAHVVEGKPWIDGYDGSYRVITTDSSDSDIHCVIRDVSRIYNTYVKLKPDVMMKHIIRSWRGSIQHIDIECKRSIHNMGCVAADMGWRVSGVGDIRRSVERNYRYKSPNNTRPIGYDETS